MHKLYLEAWRFKMSARRNGKKDTGSVWTVSSTKPSAQRHAEAWGVEMVTTHVTEVATYFHYCRKVTLCLRGKSPNYNFTAPTKRGAAAHLGDNSENHIGNILRKSMPDIHSER